ncbi:hypothetical protein SBA2_200007 [Acidobacteriia bacterium SbA2]|nr:hypothetical protein SBA2_200007 [Acidobacteriia bacterium SbA2]
MSETWFPSANYFTVGGGTGGGKRDDDLGLGEHQWFALGMEGYTLSFLRSCYVLRAGMPSGKAPPISTVWRLMRSIRTPGMAWSFWPGLSISPRPSLSASVRGVVISWTEKKSSMPCVRSAPTLGTLPTAVSHGGTFPAKHWSRWSGRGWTR